MYIDSQLLLSKEQTVTADAASTNVIDLGVSQDIGRGEPMAVVVVVNEGADFTTEDETYAFQVRTGSTDTPTTVIASQAIDASDLVAGSRHVLPIGFSNDRYLAAYYDVDGTTPSVTVTTFLAPMSMVASEDRVYDSGYTIK